MEKNEVEFKFLVENVHSIPIDNVKTYYINQIYLENELQSERVRLMLDVDTSNIEYYHTTKVPAKEGYLERESIITQSEFNSLKQRAKKKCEPISKIRRVFDYNNVKMELDSFSLPIQFTMLEVEVESLSDKIKLPPFISIVEDVTFLKEFSNASISKRPEATERKINKLFSKSLYQYRK